VKKDFFYGYVIIASIFFIQMVMVGPRISYGVFIKPLTDEFGWSRALISGAYSISAIVLGLSGVVMGWFNDRVGPRIVVIICGILTGSGLMLMYFMHSTWQLYLFYSIIFGLGMGGLISPQMSTVTRWFISRRNIMLGLLMAGGGLGGIIGPPFITWLVYTYSWREALLFTGIGVLVLVILLAQFLKRDPSQTGQIPYQKGNETRKKTYVVIEELSLNQALRTGKFWLFSLMMFCMGFCGVTILVHVAPLAIDRGISATSAAMILSATNVAITAGSLIIGLIADKIGSRKILIICEFLILCVILFLLPVNSAPVLGIIVVLMYLGFGGIAVLQGTIIAELFGMKSNGIILGCVNFIYTIGASLGAWLAGLLFDATGNYQWVFSVCGVLSIISIIMAISLNRARKSREVLAKG
jgi:MFS transporter, OFA family, oxalate/formate antiporter